MANALYPLFKAALLSPGMDLINNFVGSGSAAAPTAVTLKAIMVKAPFVYAGTDQFLSAAGANTVGTAQTLTSKTGLLGVLNAASITFAAVTAGSTANAVLIFMDTGSAATSRLVAYIDTLTGAVPMSVVTNGGDVTVNWDTGASKIFAL